MGDFVVGFCTLSGGIKMPLVGVGTFMLSPDEAQASVGAALKAGCRLVDTANAYMNEKAVGRAVRASGIRREEIFLQSKLWPAFYEQPDGVERTMARLGVDYIDLMFLHHPTRDYMTGFIQLEEARLSGRIRAIGLSNFTPAQIGNILRRCRVRPAVVQAELHPYLQQKELAAFLKREGIALQAWFPLGHGDRRLLSEPVFLRLAEKYGKTPAQIVLRWHLDSGHSLVVGSREPAHLAEDQDIFDFTLTAGELGEISALDAGRSYSRTTPDMLSTYAAFVPPVAEQK